MIHDPMIFEDGPQRSNYGLSSCASSNGCFTKVAQDGSANLPTADSGWVGESSLDLYMVSVICLNCSITLVEADCSEVAERVAV
ncbi:hypothetical protein [Streptomyces similanensis]